MTDTAQPMFSVGDVITNTDKRSILFRRDAIVAYAEERLFSIITDGLPEIFFFDNPAPFNVVTKGTGKLSEEQHALLHFTLSSWDYMGVISKFPDLVDGEMKNVGVDTNDMESIAIMAKVPKKLAFYWRQQHAALVLARHIMPQLPQDVEQLMAQWGMLSALKIGASVHGPDIIRQMFGSRSK